MRAKEWERHIEEQSRSGETIKLYCERRGINHKTFSFHKYNLKSKGSRNNFVSVSSGGEPIRVEVPGGIVLSVLKSDLPEVLELLMSR